MGSSNLGWLDEDQVMSEVHLGCPPDSSVSYISRFTISLPISECNQASSCQVGTDGDGDLILTRRAKLTKGDVCMLIQHNVTSSIPRVGLQVWKAELVLADFVIHKMFTSTDFHNVVAIELGAGTGLVGMLLARVADAVFLTDRCEEVLDNCAKNVLINSGLFQDEESVFVRELDWNNSWPPKVIECSSPGQRYSWTASDIEELQRSSLLLAADVIYNDDLTDAFFCILERLMSQGPKKVLYLALEKRYNFTLDDIDVVANGYLHFRSYLTVNGEGDDNKSGSTTAFVGNLVDLVEIPKYVTEYDRGNDVELWQIRYYGNR